MTHVDVQVRHLREVEEKRVHEAATEGGLAHVLRSDDEGDGGGEQAGDALGISAENEMNLLP